MQFMYLDPDDHSPVFHNYNITEKMILLISDVILLKKINKYENVAREIKKISFKTFSNSNLVINEMQLNHVV